VSGAAQVSLWEATAPAAAATPSVQGALRADIAIVGAGFTGLSAALHLAEAGRDVVVIDAQAPGWGASGRNGGQVIAGVKYDPDVLEQKHGPAMVEAVGSGPDLVFDLIRRHAIACDPVRTGWLQLAVSEATMRAAAARAAQWQARGAPVRVLDAQEAKRLSGSGIYVGGWLDLRGGTVQPLAYARGLAAAARRHGARLFGASPATRLSPEGQGWRIETPQGELRAATIILATNAYADRLHDRLRRSLVPVPSYQIATDPLPEALRANILPERQSVSDMRRLLRYFRTDADGRLVMGARGVYGDAPPAQAMRRQLQAVREIYPQAAELKFPYRWGGMVAITPDHMPHLHALAPGLLAGLGYNGRGVAMATLMGKLLADWAAGRAPETLGFPVTEVTPLRLHAFSRLGVRAAVQYLAARDALERA
jgi:glycine/D-amino acid oxidase-like deaminating enzyme